MAILRVSVAALLAVSPLVSVASPNSLLLTAAGLAPLEHVLANAKIQLDCSGVSGVTVESQSFDTVRTSERRATEVLRFSGCGRSVDLSVSLQVGDGNSIQVVAIKPAR